MHRKYSKDGLAVISVALDDKEFDADVHTKIIKFLQAKEATMTNLWLDEPIDLQKKFGFIAPPAVFVFNRAGKWTRFTSDKAEINYEEIDKLVIDLLREK
jgi:hypothetical protein